MFLAYNVKLKKKKCLKLNIQMDDCVQEALQRKSEKMKLNC